MKIKLAIIGSKIPVNAIDEVAKEFHDLDVHPMICEKLSDAPSVTAKALDFADVIVFGGPIPYFLSQSVFRENSQATYLSYTGTTIYSTLMRIYMQYNFLPIMSIEALDQKHVHEVYDEIGMSHIPHFINILKDFNPEVIIQDHLKLWEERKIQVVVTGVQAVYERLQQLKIPVFIYKNTKQTIRETLNRAILLGMEQKRTLTQITILQFQIDEFDPHSNTARKKEYEEIKRRILDYGKQLFATTGNISENSITLYITRGVLNDWSFSILREIQRDFSQTVSLGIGMGYTADSAAYNARKALQFSQRNGGGCAFLIDEGKRVQGPLGDAESLEYDLVNDSDDQFRSLSLRKFYAWLQMIKKNEVTTRDVKNGLNTSSRHATRILKQLHDKGIAKVIGKESLNQKGRPRLIYEIDLRKLAEELGEVSK